MAEADVLWAAWSRVTTASGAPGADGIDVRTFARDVRRRLDQLAALLRSGAYEPAALRLLTITRGGKTRRRGLPTVCDRIVQRAFLAVQGAALDAGNAEVSFAYRKGRSWVDAIAQAARHRDEGLRWVARGDIDDFFASIRHDLLAEALARRLNDPAAVSLVLKWATAPVLTGHGLRERRGGLPEGAPVSPAVANAFLADFDAHVHGKHGKLIRYADDLAVFCGDMDHAVEAVRDADDALAALDLRLNRDKTYIATFDAGFTLLGWEFHGDGGQPERHNPAWTHPMLTRLHHTRRSR